MIREVPQAEIEGMPLDQRERLREQELAFEGKRLYETYGKPLEAEHWGKFVAVSRDGRTLVGETAYEVLDRAADAFGPENFVFKVGEIALGKIR